MLKVSPHAHLPRMLTTALLVTCFGPTTWAQSNPGVSYQTSSLNSAWNESAAAEDVFAAFGNPAGLAFTPGLQLGLVHEADLEGNGRSLDFAGAFSLGDLTLALGRYEGLGNEPGRPERNRIAGALNLDGSALGWVWNSQQAFHQDYFAEGTWRVSNINRLNGWLSQSLGLRGATETGEAFDAIDFGLAYRPFGSWFTVSADVVSEVWNDWRSTVALHSWFQLGDFAVLASAIGDGATPWQSPRFQLGLAYRGGHFGFGSGTTLGSTGDASNLVTHARLSSSRISSKEPTRSLLKRYAALHLVGDGRPGQSTEGFSSLFDPQLGPEQTLLALDRRMKSADVSGLFLRIDGLNMGLGRALEWHRSIKQWQDLGKEIVVYVERPGDVAYFIASAASQVWMSPAGTLMVDGIRINSLYFGNALAELGLNVQSVAAGQYKTAPRQFTLGEASDEEIEVLTDLANQYYDTLLMGLTKGRGMPEARAKEMLNRGGFTASEAVAEHLVDALVYPTDFEQELKKLHGQRVWLVDWQMEPQAYSARWDRPKKIAVIPILGTIVNGFTEQDFFGENSREATGAGTVIAALEEAVSRPDVSAIVLRVDSPGGDAMASDHIYHAVEAAVKKKPVVVSMGSYAASGGYYVAAPAQKIFAQPLTLTGSIGVYALSVNAERALQKLKIGRFDVRRGDLQNGSLLQAMNEAELLRLQEHIDDTYRQFLEAVANGRDMPLERVKEIAEGRVWTGVQAQEKGLVDHLGHLQDAVLAAASEAKIDLDATPVELILLGHGDLPITEGFKALAPKTTRQSLEAKALRAVGLSDAEIQFWSSEGAKAHLPYKILIE